MRPCLRIPPPEALLPSFTVRTDDVVLLHVFVAAAFAYAGDFNVGCLGSSGSFPWTGFRLCIASKTNCIRPRRTSLALPTARTIARCPGPFARTIAVAAGLTLPARLVGWTRGKCLCRGSIGRSRTHDDVDASKGVLCIVSFPLVRAPHSDSSMYHALQPSEELSCRR